MEWRDIESGMFVVNLIGSLTRYTCVVMFQRKEKRHACDGSVILLSLDL